MINRIKVLILEDSNTQALKLKYILEKNNYEVQHVLRAEMAIELLKNHLPDVIISDIIMPGMDGFAFCKYIKYNKTYCLIPVILLTALSDTEDIINGLECGADGFISKPYNEELLLSKLSFLTQNQDNKPDPNNNKGLEIKFAGKKHLINSSRQQIVNLLLSTYENSVLKNKELIKTNFELKETQKRLKKLNRTLDQKVKERTTRIENINSILRAIRSISQLIIKEQDRKQLINEACNIIVQSDVFQNAWITISDDNMNILDSAVMGADHKIIEMDKDFLIKNNPFCYKRSMQSNNVIVMDKNDQHCMACLNAEIIKNNNSGILAMGLQANGNNYGMINVALPIDLVEDLEEQKLFKEIAGDIAFALHKIDLEEERSLTALKVAKKVKELQCLHSISELASKNTLSLPEYFSTLLEVIKSAFQDPDCTECCISYGSDCYKTNNFTQSKWIHKVDIFNKETVVGKIEVCYLFEKSIHINNIFIEEEKDLLKTIAIHIGEYIEKKKAEEKLLKYHENLEELVKERTTELYNERNLLRILIDSLPDQIYAKDNNHRFILANKNTLDVFGLNSSAEIEGKTDFNFLSAKLAEKNHYDEKNIIHQNKDVVDFEELVNYPNNGSRWFSITKVPFKNHENKTIGLVGINRDITINKQAEIKMQKAKEIADQANQAKSLFLANMSHEIRTPMNAIIGYTEILDNRLSDPVLKDYLKSIMYSSKSLLELINEILDLSKVEAGKMKLNYTFFNLNQLLAKLELLFKMKAEEKGLNFEIVTTKSLPKNIKLDELRLRQVAINLIGNAVKFTDAGFVRITLDIKNVSEYKLDLVLKVADSGIGIPKNRKQTIFGDFTQSDYHISKEYGGTGLGLSISKRIMDLFKGKILVESKLNEGSVFTIEIPNVEYTNETLSKTKTTETDPNTIQFEKANILIVDDVKTNREILKNHIEFFDHKVYMAENGLKGVELARQIKPDIIFMDIKMPVMDGYKATKELSKYVATKAIPVIACTASVVNISEKQFLQAGFSGFLSKPILLNDLLQKLCLFISYKTVNKKESSKQVKTQKLNLKTRVLLKQNALPIWKIIEKKRSSKSQKKLADAIIQTGISVNNNYLITLGESLIQAIAVFNIEKVNAIMDELKLYLID